MAARRELLRLATAGSVDDGKSTLIGRLMYDTDSLPLDHLEAVRRDGVPDLAALSDGLRAEQEQGITIDVAYRFFSTGSRSYILADTPGTSGTRATCSPARPRRTLRSCSSTRVQAYCGRHDATRASPPSSVFRTWSPR